MQKRFFYFLLKFAAVFILLSVFFSLKPVEDLFIWIFMLIAKLFLLLFKDGSWSVAGNSIVVNGVPLMMIKECTGTAMYSLFTAFAVAYDCEKRKKLIGLGIGLLILFGLNILRILTLMVCAYISKGLLNFIHDFLWPASFFMFTLIAVAFYMKRCSK